jgi:hypothetical protein
MLTTSIPVYIIELLHNSAKNKIQKNITLKNGAVPKIRKKWFEHSL